MKKIQKFALVYQCGLANVFKVDSFSPTNDKRKAKRIYQGNFTITAAICVGIAFCQNTEVATFSCNQAGDITESEWTLGLDDCPFRDSAMEIYHNTTKAS